MVGKGGGGRLGGGKAPFWKRAHMLASGGSCGGQEGAGNGGCWELCAYELKLMPGNCWSGGAARCSSGGAP